MAYKSLRSLDLIIFFAFSKEFIYILNKEELL